MHKIYLNSGMVLLMLIAINFRLEAIIGLLLIGITAFISFILAIVIYIKIVWTKT